METMAISLYEQKQCTYRGDLPWGKSSQWGLFAVKDSVLVHYNYEQFLGAWKNFMIISAL